MSDSQVSLGGHPVGGDGLLRGGEEGAGHVIVQRGGSVMNLRRYQASFLRAFLSAWDALHAHHGELMLVMSWWMSMW